MRIKMRNPLSTISKSAPANAIQMENLPTIGTLCYVFSIPITTSTTANRNAIMTVSHVLTRLTKINLFKRSN